MNGTRELQLLPLEVNSREISHNLSHNSLSQSLCPDRYVEDFHQIEWIIKAWWNETFLLTKSLVKNTKLFHLCVEGLLTYDNQFILKIPTSNWCSKVRQPWCMEFGILPRRSRWRKIWWRYRRWGICELQKSNIHQQELSRRLQWCNLSTRWPPWGRHWSTTLRRCL